jgi:hypothetical protein
VSSYGEFVGSKSWSLVDFGIGGEYWDYSGVFIDFMVLIWGLKGNAVLGYLSKKVNLLNINFIIIKDGFFRNAKSEILFMVGIVKNQLFYSYFMHSIISPSSFLVILRLFLYFISIVSLSP